jgi:hypothetical protein
MDAARPWPESGWALRQAKSTNSSVTRMNPSTSVGSRSELSFADATREFSSAGITFLSASAVSSSLARNAAPSMVATSLTMSAVAAP